MSRHKKDLAPTTDEKVDYDLGSLEKKQEKVEEVVVEKEVKEPVKDESVTMKRSDLEKFFSEYDSLKQRLDRVEYAASKSALSKFDEKKRGEIGKKVSIRSFHGKLISGWQTLQNECAKNPMSGVYEEHITVKLFFFDGSEEIVDYRTLVRGYVLYEALVLSETKSSTGSTTFNVQIVDTGEKMDIDVAFVN